jgi:hypothetical protein
VKIKRIQISAELLFHLFAEGHHPGGYSVVKDAIPADAQLVNCQHSWPNGIELLVTSASFDDTRQGDIMPTLIPVCKLDE